MFTKPFRWRAIAAGVLAGLLVEVIFMNSLNAFLIATIASETFTGHSPNTILISLYVPIRIVLALVPLAVSSIITAALLA